MVKDRFFVLTRCRRSIQGNGLRERELRIQVFIAPAWETIYCTDDDLTLPSSLARRFGDDVRAIYERFGYT